ncbi:MAG: FAD:protein FMN transferase [bacterium]|nr:FAD:protein FMN transferase [bacterium]
MIKRLLILVLISFILLSSCSLENRRKKTFFAMGNIPVEVTLYSRENLDFERTFDEIKRKVTSLDSVFSKYNTSSDVCLFNYSDRGLTASPELLELFGLSDSMKKKTGGLFDVEIETLLSYYKRCEEGKRDVSDDSIIYYKKIISEDSAYVKGDSLVKSDKRIKIDFGGIAKGWFGDVIISIMKKNGFKKGIANLGGDIVAFNDADGEYFKIGIRSAFSDSVVMVDSIKTGSMVTSGDYFRSYDIKGKKYCHIVNPKTSSQNNEAHSVTVKANEGFMADAYATSLMLMDANSIRKFDDENEDVSIYIQK